jgi:sugar phosphate isomerase/epimerase
MISNYNRRKFVQQTLLGSLGVLAGDSFLEAAEKPGKLRDVGLILGVLQKEMKADWEGTLRQVAKMGYTHLEFNKYYGESAVSFNKFLKDVGLKPLAGGFSIGEMKKEALFKKAIEEALFLGKQYMVCYWPWPDSGKNKKLDDFKKAADDLNGVGELCNKMGIRFAMHNHDKEFVPVQGYKWGYEVLLKETDPTKVAMQLDLYWITKGGGDPVQLLKDYPERFELFHVKDMDNTSKQSFTCPGYGIIDFRKIFTQARKTNVKHYIVEIDSAERPMTCVQDSINFLKKLRY